MNLVKSLATATAILVCAAAEAGRVDRLLFKAVRAGDLALVNQLLEREGADPNRRARGETLLMCAVIYGEAAMVGALLEKGARPNDGGSTGDAVVRAVQYGRINALKLLIGHGAGVNAKDARGRTPLMRAAALGDPPMVRLLLDAGADPDIQDKNGDSSLHHAVKATWLEVADLLLAQGANHALQDQHGDTALAYVEFLRNRDFYKLFAKHGLATAPFDTPPALEPGEEAVVDLETAAVQGDLDRLRVLLSVRGGTSAEERAAALLAATVYGRLEGAKALLAAGADPNAHDEAGGTPLREAVAREDEAMVNLLVAAGADAILNRAGEAVRVKAGGRSLKSLKKALKKHPLPMPRHAPFWPVGAVGDAQVSPPVLTHRVMPAAPAGWPVDGGGHVVLEAVLERNGLIYDIAVVREYDGGDYAYEREAIKALKQWKFKPGLVDGAPTPMRMTLMLSFPGG